MGGKEEKGNSLARPERTRLGPTGAAWSSLDWICRPTLQATLRVPLFPWPEQDQQGLGCWVVAHPSRKARGHLSGGPRWMVDSEAKYGGLCLYHLSTVKPSKVPACFLFFLPFAGRVPQYSGSPPSPVVILPGPW